MAVTVFSVKLASGDGRSRCAPSEGTTGAIPTAAVTSPTASACARAFVRPGCMVFAVSAQE